MPITPEQDVRVCDVSLRHAFDLLGKRWNGVILESLRSGPAGFAELRRALGTITDSVLSDRLTETFRNLRTKGRLTELVGAELVARSVTDTRPPGVSYALTPSGTALLPVLEQLAQWAAGHLRAAGGCPSATDC